MYSVKYNYLQKKHQQVLTNFSVQISTVLMVKFDQETQIHNHISEVEALVRLYNYFFGFNKLLKL